MNDLVLSGFLSLFALFGKEEQVDETRAKKMLVNYLRHHYGIRNVDSYLDLYSDMRGVYEITDNLNAETTVASICENLQGKIPASEASMLLLRLMEFCGIQGDKVHPIFRVMADRFGVDDEIFNIFIDYVKGNSTAHVMLHDLEGTDGKLKTLLNPKTGLLIFTYTGNDTVLLNDVPVLSGTYQVWLQSSVLKGKNGRPVYYSTILDAHQRHNGKAVDERVQVEFCGRDINFRFPNSDTGMHDLSFTLHGGELLAIM